MKEQEVFDCISIINVKNKLNLHEIYSLGDTIYVRCPFCCSNKGSMILKTSNNSYICKECEERGYSIGLYAKCNHISNDIAYKELINTKPDLKSNFRSIITNNKKSNEELDYVYNAFLQELSLKPEHTMQLLKIGFSMEDIENIGFKSIPIKEKDKIQICKKLIESGYELKGTPGFYQDKHFNWNFKSHKGVFVPIINNCHIVALRIHLDNPYNSDTTDIWFSSSKKNNGTMANNNIMVLIPKQNQLQIINDTKKAKDIIIASEMILAYKIQSIYKDKIVIGIPNVIPKDELKRLNTIKCINNIYLVMDAHTILHNSNTLLSSLESRFSEDKIVVGFSIKDCEIPPTIINNFETDNINENKECFIA